MAFLARGLRQGHTALSVPGLAVPNEPGSRSTSATIPPSPSPVRGCLSPIRWQLGLCVASAWRCATMCGRRHPDEEAFGALADSKVPIGEDVGGSVHHK